MPFGIRHLLRTDRKEALHIFSGLDVREIMSAQANRKEVKCLERTTVDA
jgi:hypothetical protein